MNEEPTENQNATTADPTQAVVMLLTRIAEALERAYPVPEPTEPPKEKKPRKFRTPVVMIDSVPREHVRTDLDNGHFKFTSEGRQCSAATFVHYSNPKYFHRCLVGRAGDDGLCGNHRKQAQSTGVKDWQDVYGEKFKST